jgi:alpha-2-macroglobulin
MKKFVLFGVLFCALLLSTKIAHAGDIDPSGFSLYSGGKFFVLTDGVFAADQNIQVRFEASGNRAALEPYGGVDVRLYRIPKPLDFLKAQKNLHRPEVKGRATGEGLSNVLSYLWDSWFKKARLAWQRVFSPDARKTAVQAVPQLKQPPAHEYKTQFQLEPQFGPMRGLELVESFRYPVWQAQPNEPPKDTRMEGSSSDFVRTQAGNVILPLGKRKPGLYLVEAIIGTYRATTLAFVSNSLAVTKVSAQQALLWTVDRKSGVSRKGSRVIFTDGTGLLDQGTAGVDGVFISKRAIPERTFAMVEDEEGGVSVSENFFYDSETYQSKIYLFTDRPLYQPGDPVSVRAFGRDLKREGAKDVWSVLPGTAASLSVVDSTGLTLFTQKVKWDGANGADAHFRLPDTAESGGYSLRLTFNGEEYGAAFRVARFTKPHFDSQIYFDKPAYKVGEPIRGHLTLSYPSGQPVVGADVDLQLRAEQMSMFEGSYTYRGASPVELSKKSYRSDKRGEVAFTFPAALKPSRYIASARAMDEAAFRVTSKKEILIEGYLETYRLSSDFNATEPGKPVTIQFRRQGSDAADFVQGLTQWQAIRLEDRSVSNGAVSAADSGEFTMKLEKSGHYVVRVVDASGVTRGTRSHVVLGSELKSVTGQLEILADREDYAIGDIAKLLLTFPFKADDALLTLERNEVSAHGRLASGASWFKAKRVSPSQWKVEVPILDAHTPNIIFSVAYAKNDAFGFQNKGLAVKKPMIDIAFKPNKAEYAPGDKVVVEVETKLEGKPLSAIVAIGVVDEMIYVLQPEMAPPISEFFHHQRRNQVRTTSSLSFYSFNPSTSEGAVERDTRAAGRDLKVLQERSRRDARDTAYWNGGLRTGADGKAKFEFIMPDALTRWRMTARAMALKAPNFGAVGESKSFLLSNKEFYLKWTGPTRFRTGDVPRPALVAFNSGRKVADAEVSLKGASYTYSQKVSLRPGSNTLTLEKAPAESQLIDAKILINSKTVDSLEVPIEFVEDSWLQRQSKSIRLEKKEKLSLPTTAKNVRLKIVSDASAQFLRVADDLLEYPWGCVEQTSSRLVPLTMAVKAMQSNGTSPAILQSLIDRVAAERRRLVAMAGRNATFTWWGDGTAGSLLLTAHAYHADWRASKLLGIDLPRSDWEHLLEVYAKTDGTLLEKSYALWVISRMGLPVAEQAGALAKVVVKAPAPPLPSNFSNSTSAFFNSGEFDRPLSLLILGSLAGKNAYGDPAFKVQADFASNAKTNSPVFQAAALLYRAQTGVTGNRADEAQKILDDIRFDSPTIDRAVALAFVDQALPHAFDLKAATRAIDLGPSWKKNTQGAVTSFAWANRGAFTESVTLPTITGAVAEVVYDMKEAPKSTLAIQISRRLLKVKFGGAGDNSEASGDEEGGGGALEAVEVPAGRPLDSRALYIDEIKVNGAPDSKFLLVEAPLPPGGEVDGTTWGLSFQGVTPNFVEARPAASGLGYSIPLESLEKETTLHQLVRFSSRGKFVLPPVKIFKMYRPSDKAFETESAPRAISVQ